MANQPGRIGQSPSATDDEEENVAQNLINVLAKNPTTQRRRRKHGKLIS